MLHILHDAALAQAASQGTTTIFVCMYKNSDEDIAHQLNRAFKLPPLEELDTAAKTDHAARQLQESTVQAYKAICTRQVSGRVGLSWWQPQSGNARKAAKRTGD